MSQLNPKQEAALKLLEEDPKFENYFFNKVADTKWFFTLKERGYFAPEKAPGPKPADQEGYFTIPQWNTLPYLEHVSQQVNVPGNDKYIDELLTTIKNVSNYRDANGNHIDNYRTWWYFVKILVNIPTEKIPMDTIELIPIWLESRFDNTLPGAEITRKLLPKFLNSPNSNDWEKAEKIIEIITAIKWKKMPEELRKGLFGKEKEAKTLVDTHWLLETFKVNAEKVGKKCSENIVFDLADRLKEIFRGEEPEHYLDIEHKDKEYRITVTHCKDFEFGCSIGLIKQAQVKPENTEEQLVSQLRPETEKVFGFTITNCRDNKSFVTLMEREIRKDVRFRDLNKDLAKGLNELYQGIFSDYSYIWLESIFSPSELYIHGAEQTLTLILRDITLEKAKHDKSAAQTIFERFLEDQYQYPLFKRIVLFVICKEWNAFREKFWEILSSEDGEAIFDNYNFFADLYSLLEHNISKFSNEEKERLKAIIENGPQRYLPEDNQDRYIAYWKQKWYSALKSDPFFASFYEEQKKLTQAEVEIPFKEPKVIMGSMLSPLTKEDIIKTPNTKLVDYLKTFRTKDGWRGPTVDGLCSMLRAAVQEMPDKFIDDLKPFLDVGYLYVYNILWGIKEAWNQKKSIDWNKLLVFIKQYIENDEFWHDKYIVAGDDMSANHQWIVGVIGELIQDGTRDDAWAFSEEQLPSAQDILFMILDKLEPDAETIDGAVTHALNSPMGKLITALIYLALRIARIEDKKGVKKEPRWSQEIKARYDKLMDNGVVEVYTLVGQYMPNINYLDKDWVKQKVESISPEEDGKLWEAFMEGYLLTSRLYDNLYELMKPHYLKAIEYDFKERHANERLVEHISLQYLHGKEKEEIEDPKSLFRKLIDRWNAQQIEKMIGFFWMQRDYLGEALENKPQAKKPLELEKMKERIIRFWGWVYENIYKGKQPHELSNKDKLILSVLSKLTVFLSKIDSGNVDWLMASAPHVRIGFASPFFIEYLDSLKDRDLETTKYVQGVFLRMLESFTPDYDQKHIRSIVEYLYQSGEKESADKICNIYGSSERYFLRDLYDNNQSQDSV